jgi:hypothetical protein
MKRGATLIARLVVGLFNVLLGVGIVVGSIALGIAWLGICFGSVILGVALLFLAPHVLLLPFGFVPIGLGFIWAGYSLLSEVLDDERDASIGRSSDRRKEITSTDYVVLAAKEEQLEPRRIQDDKESFETIDQLVEIKVQAADEQKISQAQPSGMGASDLATQALQRIDAMANNARDEISSHIVKKAISKRWVFNMKTRCLIDTKYNVMHKPGEFLRVSGVQSGFKLHNGLKDWVSDQDVVYKETWD